MDFTIREASNADCKAVIDVVFAVLEEYGLKPDPSTTDKDLYDLENEYLNNRGYFGVVVDKERIIASVGVRKVDDTTCEFRKMYCLAEYRGRGLGRQLLELAIAKAKTLGYSRVILETASPLKEAIGLYKKFGFVAYTPEHIAARCDQAYELYL